MTQRRTTKGPILFPAIELDELQGVSKNALLDMIWLMSETITMLRGGSYHTDDGRLNVICSTRDKVLADRDEKQRVY